MWGYLVRQTLVLSTALAAATILVGPPVVASDHAAAGSPTPAAAGSGSVASETARVVARRDVDGDGDRDRIGYRALDRNTVRVSARISSRKVVRKRLRTTSWPRGDFYGATRFDGRRGVELVVGTTYGAHTPWFTVLTYRRGRLVVQKCPFYRTREWAVDAYANGYLGWYRRTHHGRVHMRLKYVSRVGSSARFTGRTIRYTWRHGGWHKHGTRKISYPNAAQASRIGGWHVNGLPRWPR
jgi:hypothetical protein